MFITNNTPPLTIRYNKNRGSVPSQRQKKHIKKYWRGSCQGYSGDTEALTSSCSDDEMECSRSSHAPSPVCTESSRPSNGQRSVTCFGNPFYSHMPKRRRRKKPIKNTDKMDLQAENIVHTEIDSSKVLLVSSEEYDLRLLKRERDFVRNLHDPSQSESSDTSSSSKRSKSRGPLLSGPLAVMDHGPVFEFGKDNILNEIYNMGYDGSLKRAGSPRPRITDDKRYKREAIVEKAVPIKCCTEQTSCLTMEDAISFSPLARVVFDAQPPYTIVHTNAAYSLLRNQGIDKLSQAGQPFIETNSNNDEDISVMVAHHLQKIAPANMTLSYKFFPIESRKSDYNIFEAYRKLQTSTMLANGRFLGMNFGDVPAAETPIVGNRSDKSMHFVSYYMLEIESNSHVQQSH